MRPEFREMMQEFMGRFIEALEDDFSFPEAFAVLFEFGKYVSSELAENHLTLDEQNSCVDMYLSFNEVFGILDISIFEMEEEEIPDDILQMAQDRDEAKKNKDYSVSDRLRDEIQAL